MPDVGVAPGDSSGGVVKAVLGIGLNVQGACQRCKNRACGGHVEGRAPVADIEEGDGNQTERAERRGKAAERENQQAAEIVARKRPGTAERARGKQAAEDAERG